MAAPAPPRSALGRFVGLERLLAIDMGARHSGLAVRTSPLLGVQRYGVLERQHVVRSRLNQVPPRGGSWSWALKPERHTGSRPSRFTSQAAALWSLIDGLRIDGVVIGMPYLADGERSRECDIVEAVVAGLQRSWPCDVPILMWDESFSTRFALGPGRHSAKQLAWGHAAVACQLLAEVLHAKHQLEVMDNGKLAR